jgi:uncharacterized membrane protein YhaH (DUF805 family)
LVFPDIAFCLGLGAECDLDRAPILILVYLVHGLLSDPRQIMFMALSSFLSLIMYSLTIPLIVRRYHDLNISGWRLFLDFAPFVASFAGVGFIFMELMSYESSKLFAGQVQLEKDLFSLFNRIAVISIGFFLYRLYTFFFRDGTDGANHFGEDPAVLAIRNRDIK